MKNLSREIDANYTTFSQTWHAEMGRVFSSLGPQDQRYLAAYKRTVSIQAWRSDLLERIYAADAHSFVLEAQNDAIVALILARLGTWRSSLQSLRSCLENILFAAYYNDHPIELQLWHTGQHRMSFSQLETYFLAHPQLRDIPESVRNWQQLSVEYSTLSRAVHGSAASFRMSDANAGTQIWSDEVSKLGMWETRQKQTLTSINHLLLCLFREHLQGTSLQGLRKAISFVIGSTKHRRIRETLGVALYQQP